MGIKLFFASLAVIGAMALAFGWYFNTTQKRISILTENAAKLEGCSKYTTGNHKCNGRIC